jgi:IclR family KDG regulon transcriptional repressor
MDGMVRSVVLIIGVLEALADEKQLGVSELAVRLGIHKSTVYRFLSSLQTLGYVRQIHENEKYGLSYKILDLAGRVLSGIDVRQAARPVMKRISDKSQETVHLATLEKSEVIYIDKIDSRQPLRMHSYVGQKIPLHASALGKVLLAWGPDHILGDLLEKGNLKRFTDTSITDPEELKEEIQKIRNQGYAEDREESVPGVRCVAAPIRNSDGSAVAAISISLPSLRFDKTNIPALRKIVCHGALEISQQMGFKEKVLTAP